jgi:cytochrome c
MKAANKTWDEATLDAYLTDPKAMVPGTKMSFAGLPKPEDRANVIAYLATLK